MKKLPWTWFDHRTDVPPWIAAGIGRIAVEWAFLEREMEEIIRMIADVDLRNGRLFTTGMNMRTRATVATNFLQNRVYHGNVDPALLEDFIGFTNKITEGLESQRNMVVHGLWDCQNGEWRVLRTTSSRKVEHLLGPELKRLSRAVIPEPRPVNKELLASIARQVCEASRGLKAYHNRFQRALAPLQHKPPQYTRRHHRYRAHRKTKR